MNPDPGSRAGQASAHYAHTWRPPGGTDTDPSCWREGCCSCATRRFQVSLGCAGVEAAAAGGGESSLAPCCAALNRSVAAERPPVSPRGASASCRADGLRRPHAAWPAAVPPRAMACRRLGDCGPSGPPMSRLPAGPSDKPAPSRTGKPAAWDAACKLTWPNGPLPARPYRLALPAGPTGPCAQPAVLRPRLERGVG